MVYFNIHKLNFHSDDVETFFPDTIYFLSIEGMYYDEDRDTLSVKFL